MIDLKRFENLKYQMEEAQKKTEQAKGALSQLMKQLKEEFDCNSLEDAEILIKQMKGRIGKQTKKYEKLLEDFKKWEDELENG